MVISFRQVGNHITDYTFHPLQGLSTKSKSAITNSNRTMQASDPPPLNERNLKEECTSLANFNSTQTLPPWLSAIERTMASPNPEPCWARASRCLPR